jgi:uncharacterized protein YkwD
MKLKTLFLLVLANCLVLTSFSKEIKLDSIINPLKKYASIWADHKYDIYNTASTANYLSLEEKNVLWVLNLSRAFPQQFLNTVVLNPKSEYYVKPEKRNHYFISLMTTMKKMKPILVPLTPDSTAFMSARCHAIQSGIDGSIGHDRSRSGCNKEFQGECCDYGNDNAVDILLNLLVDDGIPGVGHRLICLSTSYTKIGISIQPHKVYEVNTVMDFKSR